MLHIIFQEHGLYPDEVYKKPKKVKQFMYASTMLKLEDEKKAAGK